MTDTAYGPAETHNELTHVQQYSPNAADGDTHKSLERQKGNPFPTGKIQFSAERPSKRKRFKTQTIGKLSKGSLHTRIGTSCYRMRAAHSPDYSTRISVTTDDIQGVTGGTDQTSGGCSLC